MRLRFEDHAGFQRATLHVAVACSALAAAGALAGSEQFGPGLAVLAAACATVALALGHLRLSLDPVGEAVARAATAVDAAGRTLLGRAASAHDRIVRIVGASRFGSPASGSDSRALAAASGEAVRALAELLGRRQSLSRAVAEARPPGAADELEALEAKRDAAADPVVRETYARAAATAWERGARAAALEAVVARIDARALAAVGELEAAALACATRDDLGPTDPAAALAVPCERLRAATAELGAEHEAFAELRAL
jgi:hypothetical protein